MADNSKFVPPKGMRDWLPQETLLRQKLIRLIESHYQLYGFQPIDTPVMENIEVLQGKGGGENEKLMFKVVKRGEDFLKAAREFDGLFHESDLRRAAELSEKSPESLPDIALAVEEGKKSTKVVDIADLGLRFDMTVPLARYYGNHVNDLPKPFRCYHIGPVWRADRPQKGRFREFYQCDIDVIGSTVESCEVELLLATDRVLKALNIGKFKIRISDKRLLPILLSSLNLTESEAQIVAVGVDKLDKKSPGEILDELKQTLKFESFENVKFIFNLDKSEFHLARYVESIIPERKDEFKRIIDEVDRIRQRVLDINKDARIQIDHLLVRGFDYYTGPVFEINVEDKNFTFSIGGGGRYDGLIEKLGGPKNTPAVGLSLGFERILTILLEKEGGISKTLQPRVYVVNDGKSEKDIQVLAESLRSHGIAVETGLEKKDKVKQLVTAQGSGLEYAITDFVPGAQTFKVRQLSSRQDTEMNAEQLKAVLQKLL